MRRFIAAYLIALWPGLAMAALPTTVSYQGLMKSPGGVVIDATQSIRFTLYDQPTGGTSLWTETQLVTIEEGLFTVALGSVTPFGDIWSSHEAYYVETEVLGPGGFEILVPRQRLISTPFALESASLHGDVETEQGKVKLEFGVELPSTSIKNVELRSSAADAGLTVQDSSKSTGSVARGIVLAKPTGAVGASFTTDEDMGHPKIKAGMEVELGRAMSSVEADPDADGDPNVGSTVVAETYDGGPGLGGANQAIESRVVLKSYFEPGATPSSDSKKIDTVDGSGVHSTVRAFTLNGEGMRDYQCTPDSVVDVTVVTDGPSRSSSSMRSRINQLENKLQNLGIVARSTVTTTLGDGVTVTMEDSSETTGARAQGIIVVRASAGTAGASQILNLDVDGDGIPDVGTEWTAIKDRTELKSEFQVADFPTETEFAHRLDSSGGHVSVVSADVTSDGRSDLRCSPDSVVQMAEVSEGGETSSYTTKARKEHAEARAASSTADGISTATTMCDDSARVELQDSSTTSGAKARGIITVKASSGGTGGSQRFAIDHDGDGTDDGTASLSCDETQSSWRLAKKEQEEAKSARAQVNDDGASLTLGDATTDGYMELNSSAGSGPGAQPSSTFRMGRPAVNEAILYSNDHGSKVTTTSPGGSAHVQCWDGSCRILLTDTSMGSEDTSIVIDATSKRFGIGLSDPQYPLHHSSGAHLTVAGDWTNASDLHSKENFKAVDGEKLLHQIEKLSITQWNYRNQSANVTHIGPTAQEFKQVFGVGDDDKTISTIDPSGIALAAIQELTRQNRELREQLEALKSRLEQVEAK